MTCLSNFKDKRPYFPVENLISRRPSYDTRRSDKAKDIIVYMNAPASSTIKEDTSNFQIERDRYEATRFIRFYLPVEYRIIKDNDK